MRARFGPNALRPMKIEEVPYTGKLALFFSFDGGKTWKFSKFLPM